MRFFRDIVVVTIEAFRRPGLTTATERYLWISAWCLSGIVILFGIWAWIIVSVLLAIGFSLGFYLYERERREWAQGRLEPPRDESGHRGT